MVSLILLIKYFFFNKASLKLGFLKTLFHFFLFTLLAVQQNTYKIYHL